MTDELEVAIKNMIAKILASKPRPRFWLINECVRRLEDQVDDESVNHIVQTLLNAEKLTSSIVDGVEIIAMA